MTSDNTDPTFDVNSRVTHATVAAGWAFDQLVRYELGLTSAAVERILAAHRHTIQHEPLSADTRVEMALGALSRDLVHGYEERLAALRLPGGEPGG